MKGGRDAGGTKMLGTASSFKRSVMQLLDKGSALGSSLSSLNSNAYGEDSKVKQYLEKKIAQNRINFEQ